MANDSTTPGYLIPSGLPAYDDALDDIFQSVIQGITGFTDGSLIRPRWQVEPPNMPDFATNWIAFGITELKVDTFTYNGHDPTGNGGAGVDTVERDETLSVLHSFYGPNGHSFMSLYREGLAVGQNRDVLYANGIKVIEVQDAFMLPALLKEKWVKRHDMKVIFKRRVILTYNVDSLLSASAVIDNEFYKTTVTTSTP